MTTQNYIDTLNKRFKSGMAREHSYRTDLETLIRTLVTTIEITNEPANVTDCGNPDYVITKGKIPIGFIEAKDIGKDLKSKQYKEQFDRYRKALDNLIITDYTYFLFYEGGELIHEIRIAEIENGKIKAIPENFVQFENLITNFCTYIGQTIKSSKKLANMMASKARLLQVILENAVSSDEEKQENSSIKAQYETFKQILIHDLTPKAFADIYAQTLAYGMFAARLHDDTLENFSRQEAAELIPKTNPFLRKLFQYVAGYDIDERIKTTVDNLADVFRAVDLQELLKNFGKSTQTQDPIIHFYEDFLTAYDPKLRKSRGVWYTPEPVVKFIVRAVDDILKTDFNLKDGLADTTKTKIKVKVQGKNKPVEKEVHKVQILDPATGTGTFLAEVVKYIYNKRFKAMQGVWSSYVENDLIPRLNGFELLMASYAMAHLKLDMLLAETGYKATKDQRFNIFLTNSLEEHHPDSGTLFSQWLSQEANEANRIKRDTPVMVILGNPPYAVSSSNKGKWIQNLLKDYKKNLNERNIQPLSDDYIKFIRFGEHFINKTGEGVLAYISNNSFIDGIIHRQMRKHLLETFDEIYILNLHGNAKRKEIAPDGSPDKNVFDIMQGVSINIFVKKSKNIKSGKIFHFDLYGKRDDKYNFLNKNCLNSINWDKLKNRQPDFFFTKKEFKHEAQYIKGFCINSLFKIYSAGIQSKRDSLFYDSNKIKLKERIKYLLSNESYIDNKFISEFNIKDSSSYKITNKVKLKEFNKNHIIQADFRPFDKKYIYYDINLIGRAFYKTMQQLKHEDNLGLVVSKQCINDFRYVLISNSICDMNLISNAGSFGAGFSFPLYLYPSNYTLFSSNLNNKKNILNKNLEEAQSNYNKIKKYFSNTVKPFYENLDNPDDAHLKLYEEHQATLEEAKTSVEIYETKILELNNTSEENIESERVPNLNMEIVDKIEEKLDITFVPEKIEDSCELTIGATFAPIDILDYIYAVLHSPAYREKYKEFLKIDFPRVPYPKNTEIFWQLVKLGSEIRQIHLLESPKVEEFITSYPKDGTNQVTTKIAKKDWVLTDKTTGRIWINDQQYFDNIPLVAWEFYIGGYQPAQKWLKDRSPKKGQPGRTLSFDDILHYQKIIVALTETDRIMKEIDKIGIE